MITRTIPPITGIPLEIWQAAWITFESTFSGIISGGAADTEFTKFITGGNATTTY